MLMGEVELFKAELMCALQCVTLYCKLASVSQGRLGNPTQVTHTLSAQSDLVILGYS